MKIGLIYYYRPTMILLDSQQQSNSSTCILIIQLDRYDSCDLRGHRVHAFDHKVYLISPSRSVRLHPPRFLCGSLPTGSSVEHTPSPLSPLDRLPENWEYRHEKLPEFPNQPIKGQLPFRRIKM